VNDVMMNVPTEPAKNQTQQGMSLPHVQVKVDTSHTLVDITIIGERTAMWIQATNFTVENISPYAMKHGLLGNIHTNVRFVQ
jgi:hypothetical protein